MKPEVVVVGGGAIGVCSALELARRGARVTLLERGPELASGCSAGNAGLICPSHSTPIANPVQPFHHSSSRGQYRLIKRFPPRIAGPHLL
jgi:glycine/D-amino acid oxidase-like deaminating enzyme